MVKVILPILFRKCLYKGSNQRVTIIFYENRQFAIDGGWSKFLEKHGGRVCSLNRLCVERILTFSARAASQGRAALWPSKPLSSRGGDLTAESYSPRPRTEILPSLLCPDCCGRFLSN